MSEVVNETVFEVVTTANGAVIVGSPNQSNRIRGTADAIRIQGGDLADTLVAGGNPDMVIYGFDGNDSIIGGAGDNELYGNQGNDTIYGIAGNNLIYGGQGDDLIYGGDGNNSLSGDKGNDTLVGGTGNDIIRGGDGDDLIYGGGGNNQLFGEKGNDTIIGGPGNDTIYGGQGNDFIRGGDGNDFIAGDKGNDTLTGGAGADIFAITASADQTRDVITDFNSAEGDIIALRAGAGYDLNSFQTVATDADASGLSGLVYIQSTGVLLFNGEEIAEFLGTPDITASDFELF